MYIVVYNFLDQAHDEKHVYLKHFDLITLNTDEAVTTLTKL